MNAYNTDTHIDMNIQDIVLSLSREGGLNLRAMTARTVFNNAMIELGVNLCCECGVPYSKASNFRSHELIAFYNVALKSPEAARRMALKYQDGTASPMAPSQWTASAPASPSGLSEQAIQDMIAETMAQLSGVTLDTARGDTAKALKQYSLSLPSLVREAANEILPRPVAITVADLPTVTFQTSHPALPRLLRKAANRKASWLVGPRGSGKSMGARQVAQALNLTCHVMTGAEDATDIVGYIQPHDGSVKRTPFREAWEHGGVILLDEMDTYNPAALIVINDALANWECSFPDGQFKVHPDCIVIAGTNTDGRGATNDYSARSVIDASTRDRFAYIPWDYCADMETQLGSANPAWTRYVQAVRKAMDDMSMGDTPSPRATIEGATDIVQGDSWAEVAESRIFKGLAPDYIRRIQAAVPMAEYEAQCPYQIL